MTDNEKVEKFDDHRTLERDLDVFKTSMMNYFMALRARNLPLCPTLFSIYVDLDKIIMEMRTPSMDTKENRIKWAQQAQTILRVYNYMKDN